MQTHIYGNTRFHNFKGPVAFLKIARDCAGHNIYIVTIRILRIFYSI